MINSNLRNHGRLPRRDDNWAQLLIVNSDFYRMRVDIQVCLGVGGVALLGEFR